jgi:hydrogenase expression/formation protein HypD
MNSKNTNIYVDKIHKIAKDLDKIKIMEVCGGHTNTIMRFGIREIMPSNVKLISGPGCPVCVTSQHDIDNMIAIAKYGITVTTYGDMLRVPGSNGESLETVRALGANVIEVTTATDVLKYPSCVFFGIGFETTTPMTAFLLSKGICVYSAHKVMPPPMKIIASGELGVDGFIDPGHVSVITGSKIWDSLNVPQVISGFKPDQMIRAIYKLLLLIRDNKKEVVNDYTEAVNVIGNLKAQELINNNMKIVDTEWRGFGVIKNSGLDPIDDKLNAKLVYQKILKDVVSNEIKGCRCGEVIKGLIEPNDCSLFKTKCNPQNPMGACMVSEEGACSIYYKFGK